ncbi:MAG: hypothetical protein MR419_06100, partial [Clostridiales bacterium]|nr:hypothetical protein [Clostridiales bacterium]MDY4172419.1 hypothetical protein [Evtepia sp.]
MEAAATSCSSSRCSASRLATRAMIAVFSLAFMVHHLKLFYAKPAFLAVKSTGKSPCFFAGLTPGEPSLHSLILISNEILSFETRTLRVLAVLRTAPSHTKLDALRAIKNESFLTSFR